MLVWLFVSNCKTRLHQFRNVHMLVVSKEVANVVKYIVYLICN